MPIFKKYSIFVIILLFIFSLSPSHFSAHAYIKKSTPFDNQTLTKPPSEVVIQFDEAIQSPFDSIKVFDSAGNRVDKQNGQAETKQSSILKTELKRNLPHGTYRVEWRVISADGHPVDGAISFQIGNSDQSSSAVNTGTKGYTPKTDMIIIRWLQYISNACYVGMLFLYLILLPKELRRNPLIERIFSRGINISLLILFISIVISLPLQATIESGVPWSKVFKLQLLEDVITGTYFGQIWLIQLAMLVILALITSFLVMAASTKRLIQWGCFVLGIALLLAKAYTSHAAAQTYHLITLPMDFIHLLAASIWVGSLIGFVAFLPLLRNLETKALYLQFVKGFCKWGIGFVLIIAATGVFAGFQYIPDTASLTNTNYGKVLLGKVSLFILMLILAAINFYKARKLSDKGLSGSLLAELVTGAVILILTVILTNLPTALSSPGPFQQTNTEAGNKITLQVTPNVIGKNAFSVVLKDAKGQPLNNIAQITMASSMLDMDMGTETVNLKKTQVGKYEAKGLYFIMTGKWNVHVHVLTKSLDSIDTDFHCTVGSQ